MAFLPKRLPMMISGGLSDPAVQRRFVLLLGLAILVMVAGWGALSALRHAPPGDYETRQGDILLGDRNYAAALERFSEALRKAPTHRGAQMGRAIALLQSGRNDEAEAAFTELIDHLTASLEPDDATGIGTLAAAHANRGILYDREARYEMAMRDYLDALRVDRNAVAGPGLMHKILLQARPSTVADRARYLQQQLMLPETERLLQVPEIDARQRMHKP
jgi:tetratricopeptide (TPR) repeat protein